MSDDKKPIEKSDTIRDSKVEVVFVALEKIKDKESNEITNSGKRKVLDDLELSIPLYPGGKPEKSNEKTR